MSNEEKIIYMDNAATTPLLPEVLDAMMPYLTEKYGNASSIHSKGYEAKLGVIRAKEQVAELLNCEPEHIYFTSGATESNNWILSQDYLKTILTSTIEHPSIYITGSWYNRNTDKKVRHISVNKEGVIEINRLEELINYYHPDLVSIMYANNEIGTIEPINEIAQICKDNDILFHTDATQALGHLPISLKDSNINYLSASAHKIGGPKGIGLLYCNTYIEPYLFGGHQENRLRAGTYNVAGIVGFGKACEIARQRLITDKEEFLNFTKEYFIYKMKNEIQGIQINTPTNSLANNINVSFKGIDGETLMMMLNDKGIICSTGSACNSGVKEPSRVLRAIEVPLDYIYGTIRFSINYDTKIEDIIKVIKELKTCINYLRGNNE